MLACIRVLQLEHVARQLEPSSSLYQGMPGYGDLLDHTNRVARSAKVVAEVAGQGIALAPGADNNAFWEGSRM